MMLMKDRATGCAHVFFVFADPNVALIAPTRNCVTAPPGKAILLIVPVFQYVFYIASVSVKKHSKHERESLLNISADRCQRFLYSKPI